MESTGGREGVWDEGEGGVVTRHVPETSKLHLFVELELLLATSHFPLFLSHIFHFLSLFLVFVFHPSSKSVKVALTGPGTPPFLSLPAIGPINIFSRGVSKWRLEGGGLLERIGRWTMAAYDNLLFIGASRQCFHQPPLCLRPHAAVGPTNHAASCQTHRHRHTHTNTEHTHTHTQVTH